MSHRRHPTSTGLLLELGMAEVSAGLTGWLDHLQRAIDAASSPAAAAAAAMALALALSRAQRFGEAIEVLDRASSSLDAPASRARAPARGLGRWRGNGRRRDGADGCRAAEGAARAGCRRGRRSSRAARVGGVHLGAHERAGRGRRRTCHASDRRRRSSAARCRGQAVALVRNVVLADHGLADLGRAIRAGASSARRVDRRGTRNRRQQPACRGPRAPRLARPPTRRPECRRGRHAHAHWPRPSCPLPPCTAC